MHSEATLQDLTSLAVGADGVRSSANPAPMTEPAFRGFYERSFPSFSGYVRRIARDEALAEDVVQESYLRFLQAPVEDTGEGRLRSYLYRIATNLVMDHWRKGRRDRVWRTLRVSDPEEAPAPETLPVDMGRALAGLEPRARAMLWLAYVEGLDHREIAEVMGLRETGIRVQLFRHRKRLARLLESGRSEPRSRA